MTSEAHTEAQTGVQTGIAAQTPRPAGSGLALRLTLASGVWSVPLHRLHHLAGYATLSGEPDEYFLGWLLLPGEYVPVFDLNRVVCDQPTPPHFGSRILVLKAAQESPSRYIGLLAAGITDTLLPGDGLIEPLDLESYLPMLYSLVPAVPDGRPVPHEDRKT